jgi:putative acetyltransferase
MIIFIGGVSYAGKTLMAQRLLEKYKFPYMSIDHLKMGLYRADTDCGVTPTDSSEHIGEILWPILKGIVMTNIENKQNLIIEGCYLFPQKINELEPEYLDKTISLYLGFGATYIKRHFEANIRKYRSAIEDRGYEWEDTIDDYILLNKEQKEIYEKYNTKYFEIQDDFKKEMDIVYAWLDNELLRRRPNSNS